MRNLTELYDYAQRAIIAGHTRRSEQAFVDALGVLKILSEGWSEVKMRVMGDHEAAETPEKQSEAAPERNLNHLYAEPPRDLVTAQDWSC